MMPVLFSLPPRITTGVLKAVVVLNVAGSDPVFSSGRVRVAAGESRYTGKLLVTVEDAADSSNGRVTLEAVKGA
jgi:hypothetical protein